MGIIEIDQHGWTSMAISTFGSHLQARGFWRYQPRVSHAASPKVYLGFSVNTNQGIKHGAGLLGHNDIMDIYIGKTIIYIYIFGNLIYWMDIYIYIISPI